MSLIATRGCHNRCGFCYLATEGLHMPYAAGTWSRWWPSLARASPTACSPTTTSARPEYLRALCRAIRPLEKIWSAAVTIDVTDDPARPRDGPGRLYGRVRRLRDAERREPHRSGQTGARTGDYARRVRIFHDHGIQVNGSFVLGFDHDRPDVFARTAEWIEQNRLECSTFHILTPYPATPLFRQMEAEGRLLHRDWSLYDTAHAVFRPRHMTPDELEEGYAWTYRRLFSHASIWRRRPEDWRAVPPYLAMSYLYRHSNRFWHLLIKHDLVNSVWRPLVELTRTFQRRSVMRTATNRGVRPVWNEHAGPAHHA